MSELKTKPTTASVEEFIAALPDERNRQDCEVILRMMREVTGEPPVLWGSSIIGFGTMHYVYASGHSGDWAPIGFSPRKANFSLYFMCSLENLEDQLARLGKHSCGKSCLYIKRLGDIDLAVLREIIETAHKEYLEQSA